MGEIGVKEAKSYGGLELKIARLRAGLKQYELAAKVGIAPTQLSEFETGRRELPPGLLDQILRAINSSREMQHQI